MMRTMQAPVLSTALASATRAFGASLFVQLSKIPRKVLIATIIAVTTAVLLFLYFSALFSVRTASAAPQVSSDTVYLGTPAAAVPANAKAPVQEVHIANNGLLLLRNATVLSNARGTLRVGMTLGSLNFTWIVETDSGTEFLIGTGEKETAGDIKVGDTVTVTGTLKNSGAEPVVEADYIRE